MANTQNKILFLIAFIFASCTNTSNEKEPQNIPEGMVHVPKGVFNMGGKSTQAEADEFPNREIEVSAFLLDKAEVTNEQFSNFVASTGYRTIAEREIDWEELKKSVPKGTPKPPDSLLQPGSLVFKATQNAVNLSDYSLWWDWKVGADWKHPEGPQSGINDRMNHPVVHIAHEDAEAYATWAEKRLPTEAEWEWASMGGLQYAKYPWGNDPVSQAADKANFWQGIFPYKNYETDGYLGTAPVMSFPPNGYGLYDMGGNVWEICHDKYHANAYSIESRTIDPQGPLKSFDPREPFLEKYVTRGGSFLCNDSYCSGYRSARRMSVASDSGLNHTGFRCAKSI